MKKRILFFVLPQLLVTGLLAQAPEDVFAPFKFKPRYAGTSVSTGVMFSPGFGSAYYFAPKISFQTTPRLFLNAGLSVVQYSLMPSRMTESSAKRSATDTYIFAEGVYLLNEKWSINGSVMKNVTPTPARRTNNPYSAPNEAMHLGIDYKVTPNVTIGAKIGYSNGNNNNINMSHSYPPF